MSPDLQKSNTDEAIASAQMAAYHSGVSAQIVPSAIALTLIVWVAKEATPDWYWAPALTIVYIVSAVRLYMLRQYRKNPGAKTPSEWGFGQTLASGVAGAAYGFVITSLTAHDPLPYQLFIITVATISASAAAMAGFTYIHPSRAFICTTLIPLAAWFYTSPDRLHLVMGIMLTIYIPMILWQGTKHHRAFINTLILRFKNEFLAKELARQRKIAEDLGQAKTRFLAAASHDLRQPVQALVIFQDLLRQEMHPTKKGEQYFARAQSATDEIASLLESLLDISRLDADTFRREDQPVLVGNLFDAMRNEFSLLAEKKGIRLRIVGTSAYLQTDPGLLGQILRNLISNALRYTPAGKVLVGCRHRRDRLDIEVWDTGIGIVEEHHHAIFDEFFQVGNPERNRQHGLGLGLTIVSRASKLLNSTISVRSKLGKGSCFTLSLPANSRRVRVALPPTNEMTPPPLKLTNRLIVLIENEASIRKGIQSLLQGWGCDVISGDSCENVLGQIRQQDKTIDALISDFWLPGESDGIQAIQKIRAHCGSEFPALLITGDTSQTALRAALSANLQIHFKPVRPMQLQQTLSQLLN